MQGGRQERSMSQGWGFLEWFRKYRASMNDSRWDQPLITSVLLTKLTSWILYSCDRLAGVTFLYKLFYRWFSCQASWKLHSPFDKHRVHSVQSSDWNLSVRIGAGGKSPPRAQTRMQYLNLSVPTMDGYRLPLICSVLLEYLLLGLLSKDDDLLALLVLVVWYSVFPLKHQLKYMRME